MLLRNPTWMWRKFATETVYARSNGVTKNCEMNATDAGSSISVLSRSTEIMNRSELCIKLWPRFFILWQIIGCVSAYDAFLAMKYRDELRWLEQNLLGRLLLFTYGGDPSAFLGVKFLGTMMVLGVLANLFHRRPDFGIVIASGVAIFQLGLLGYLTFR